MSETIIPGAPPKAGYDVNLKGLTTIRFAAISASSSGNNTIVAADTIGRKIKILSYVIVSSGDVTVTFKSGSTSLSGAMPLTQYSGISAAPVSPAQGAYMETNANESFIITLSGAINVSGHLSYYLE